MDTIQEAITKVKEKLFELSELFTVKRHHTRDANSKMITIVSFHPDGTVSEIFDFRYKEE